MREGPRQKPPFFKHTHRESDVLLADVEADSEAFSAQLYASMRHGPEEFPCVVFDGTPVPLDYVEFARAALWGRGMRHFEDFPFPFPFRHFFHEMRGDFKEWFGGPGISLTSVHPMEALGLFRGRVVDFLTDRFAGRSLVGVSPSPGVRFKVNTQNQGERVHYSPAYFVKLSTVFGAPTSPVISWIQPGRYVFAVVGPNGRMRFDPGQFAVPPSHSAQLTV